MIIQQQCILLEDMFLLLNRNPFLLANLVSMLSQGICCRRGSGITFTTFTYPFNPYLVTNQQVYNAQANDVGILFYLFMMSLSEIFSVSFQ